MTRMTRTLMNINCDIWDELGIECGSDFLNEDETKNKKWDLYVSNIAIKLEEKNIITVSKKVYSELEDVNCHSLNSALEELGMIA